MTPPVVVTVPRRLAAPIVVRLRGTTCLLVRRIWGATIAVSLTGQTRLVLVSGGRACPGSRADAGVTILRVQQVARPTPTPPGRSGSGRPPPPRRPPSRIPPAAPSGRTPRARPRRP